MWRFRGSPHYLDIESKRFGVTKVLADRCRNNAEIYRCSVLLSQLAERYHKAPKDHTGMPVFGRHELAQVQGTLDQVNLEIQKLHVLAGAAAEMHREASEAYGLPVPDRLFILMADTDSPPTLPLGDGTVGIPPNGELAPAIAESG